MRKPEQRVWDSMKRAAPSGVWMERIENLLGDGIPDVLIMTAISRVCFVELKAATLPVRPTTRVLGDDGLRPSQVSWHLKSTNYNTPVYTVIRDDQRGLYMIPASLAREVNDMNVNQLRAASLASSWEDIFTILRGY